MPSQEEYLDNLLKGIETENTETEVTKEPKMTGTEEETAKAPETPEPVEESGTQVDMSDMDDLLQSALDAQKADSSEQETEASQPVAENTAILPEETASMSEDEINRLLQQSQEQSGDAPAQESNDANDDLIKMLENADDEGLSNILDQVTPETAQPEETAEREEDNGKRGKKKKEKKKKEKKELTPAQEAERQNKRNKKQIKAILKEATNTRKVFIEGILSGRIKKVTNEEKVVAELFEQMMSWETFTGHNTLKEFFLGDKCYNAQKEDIEAAEKKMEGLSVLHKLLCMVSAMVADADLVEWNYTYNTVRGEKVKAFYRVLESYGFRYLNDEEKGVVEGTSDLYVKKES